MQKSEKGWISMELSEDRDFFEGLIHGIYMPFLSVTLQQDRRSMAGLIGIFIKEAQKEALRNGHTSTSHGYGDYLLKNEKNDPLIRWELDIKRKEGVRDFDIQDWWNKPSIVRQRICQLERIFLFATIRYNMCQGLNYEQSEIMARKDTPIFEYDYVSHGSQDAPLPPELRKRVALYSLKRNTPFDNELPDDLKKYSSMNALIRSEIQLGKI